MYLKLWTVLSASVYISNAKLGDFNPFIPARPGESPACAKKGNSYCEYIEDYPVHVINYLLERGVFDTNTLFKSEQDIKPPDLTNNRTSERRKTYHEYNPYQPKQYNSPSADLGPFNHEPYTTKLYRDYINYYKRTYGDVNTNTDLEPIEPLYFSDIANIHKEEKPTHINGVAPKHAGATQGQVSAAQGLVTVAQEGSIAYDVSSHTEHSTYKTPQYSYKLVTTSPPEVKTLPRRPSKKYETTYQNSASPSKPTFIPSLHQTQNYSLPFTSSIKYTSSTTSKPLSTTSITTTEEATITTRKASITEPTTARPTTATASTSARTTRLSTATTERSTTLEVSSTTERYATLEESTTSVTSSTTVEESGKPGSAYTYKLSSGPSAIRTLPPSSHLHLDARYQPIHDHQYQEPNSGYLSHLNPQGLPQYPSYPSQQEHHYQQPPNSGYLPPEDHQRQETSPLFLPPLDQPSSSSYLPPPEYQQPSHDYLLPPEHTEHAPSHSYLPPKEHHEHPPNHDYLPPQEQHIQAPNHGYLPPQSSYNSPSLTDQPELAVHGTPGQSYLPPTLSQSYLPPSKYQLPPSKSYLPPPSYLPPLETDILPHIDDFHAQVKDKIQSLHEFSRNNHPLGEPVPTTQDKYPSPPIISENHAQEDQPKDLYTEVYSTIYPHGYPPQFPEQQYHQELPQYREEEHVPYKYYNPESKETVYVHVGHLDDHKNVEAGTTDPIHYSNRKALDDALKNLSPEKRVITVSEPPKFQRLESKSTTSNIEGLSSSTTVLPTDSSAAPASASTKTSTFTPTSTTTTTKKTVTAESSIPPRTARSSTPPPTSPEPTPTPLTSASSQMNRFALGGSTNDNFMFGPQTKPSIEKISSEDNIFREETLKNENVEKGKIIPRSFEPPEVSSPSVALPSNKININTVENSEIIGDTEVIRSHTPFGHSYRVTTPSSTVFVQRTFGISQPIKRELDLGGQNTRFNLVQDDRVNVVQEDTSVFNSLKNAVDVLTRSSLGYVNLTPLAYFNENSQEENLLTLPEFEHFTTKKSVKQTSDDQSNITINDDHSIQVSSDQLSTTGSFTNGVSTGTTEGTTKDSTKITESASSTGRSGSSMSTPSTGSTASTGNAWSTLSFGSASTQNVYDSQNIDKILDVMKNVRETSGGDSLRLNESELNQLIVENYFSQSTETDVDQITQKSKYFEEINLANNEIEPLPSAIPHISPENINQLVPNPDWVERYAFEVQDNQHQEKEERSTLETIFLQDSENKVLVPSFNNSVYIPKIAESVNIAVSPRSDLQFEEGNQLKQALRSARGVEPLQEPSPHIEELPRGRSLAETRFIDEDTRFQDSWVGRHRNIQEVERMKRNHFSEDQRAQHQQHQQHQQQQQQQHQQHKQYQQHRYRSKRDLSLEDEILSSDLLNLSQERIDKDKLTYIQQNELTRERRQSSDPDQLCPTVSQYIMPRAAVNSEGDWMYVVNMPAEPEYQQLVRSEICISESCRGLCSIPNGLTSKCVQQFVQKKMVALHPGGDKLVEDIFWFPSCCTCQVTQTNLEL